MNNKNKIIFAGIMVIGIAIAFSAGLFQTKVDQTQNSNVQSESKVKTNITLRYVGTPDSVAAFEVADKLGYLAEEGISLNWIGLSAGAPQDIVSLTSNQIDILHTNLDPLISAKAAGVKIRAVVAGGASQVKLANGELLPMGGLLVLKKSGINSAKDLIGKKIGVPTSRGGHADFDLKILFDQNGIKQEDVDIVVIPTANILQALKTGQVDAIYPCGATFQKGYDDSEIKVLTSHLELIGIRPTCGYSLSEDFIAKNPDVVAGFVRAYVKAWDWGWEHPKDYQEISAEIIKKKGGNVAMAKYTFPQNATHALLTDKAVQSVIDQLTEEGKIKVQITPSEIYTNKFNPYKG